MKDKSSITHLAIILDGNRRWAKRRNLPVYKGHEAGVLALEKIVRACGKKEIKYLTVYGFSIENWGRTKIEVSNLIRVMEDAIRKYTDMLDREGWRMRFIGRNKDFPKSTQSLMSKSTAQLSKNIKGTLILALSYGGRDEILRAIEKLKQSKSKIIEKQFGEMLDTRDYPDPELIIRTGGRKRLSNFLPWQSVYSELYFTGMLWPDFNSTALNRALKDYDKRQRNFGK
ncbi:MAG: polyprenyl diphosphate synthase [Patescibacteria group bacterium]|nr:polyprenyl diphosphate synthase [Patescibacteria group bacterium]